MITSHKQLTSGNFLVIRTDTQNTGDCSTVRCEYTQKPTKADKEEAEVRAASIVSEFSKYKGVSTFEHIQAKA
jgi:hypothetical protein